MTGSLFGDDYALMLTDGELHAVMRPIAPGQWGGHQQFHARIQHQLAGGRAVRLTEGEIEKAYRYGYKYGNGTWQNYSRALVTAGLRAGWTPVGDA